MLGLQWSNASAAVSIVKAKNGEGSTAIFTTQAVSSIGLPLVPVGDDAFVPHLMVGAGETLEATAAAAAELTVWYVQDGD